MTRSASGGDEAARAAREARRWLEHLLTGEPQIRELLPRGYAGLAERYAALLLGANRRVNLTRLTEPHELARLHLLDALSALPIVDRLAPRRALDLGTGGGVPGLPLALARPGMRWTLVDAVARKATALRGIVEALGIENVEVVAERAETLGQSTRHRERYDLVAARACAPLPVLVELALPLVAVGGTLLAWKGPLDEEADEVRRGRDAGAQVGAGGLEIEPAGPPSLGEHVLLSIRKDRPTPARYPRRPGVPERRPLA